MATSADFRERYARKRGRVGSSPGKIERWLPCQRPTEKNSMPLKKRNLERWLPRQRLAGFFWREHGLLAFPERVADEPLECLELFRSHLKVFCRLVELLTYS